MTVSNLFQKNIKRTGTYVGGAPTLVFCLEHSNVVVWGQKLWDHLKNRPKTRILGYFGPNSDLSQKFFQRSGPTYTPGGQNFQIPKTVRGLWKLRRLVKFWGPSCFKNIFKGEDTTFFKNTPIIHLRPLFTSFYYVLRVRH